ncbi:M20/M25/M40 family metallo-hydrolase [Congregibacter litoralis]|uniref:M20/M25/M40 family metallo-hydrolase n=1 Tax=Congregibacter litoralis TaxID=393662 RepID=UPI00006AB86F|nr:M20/M25/M40 family metallo-hydrolase [Congregibacter litoralis]
MFLLSAPVLRAAEISELDADSLGALAKDYAQSSFPLLRELLSIPNDANHPEEVEANVVWTESAFARRGFSTQRIATAEAPLLLATRQHADADNTVLIYLQIDGQPVDPSRWFQASPYTPALKQRNAAGEWEQIPWTAIENYDEEMRVFARSASDAKGPVAMFLASLDALADKNIAPNFNIKVIMDFEEELGSPNLPKAVTENRELLSADMLIIFDGPRHITNRPTLTFGARGIATVTLTTYGPVVPQHSGHFGNYAPNPALRLAKLLASMKDDEGRVTIPGFYDGISIDEATQEILRAVPDNEEEIRERLQLGSVDKVGRSYQEAIQYPSLNIRGMQSGWIDEKVRTIVPGWARAEIDIRLVLESDPERLIDLVKQHVRGQGFFVTDQVPDKALRMAHEKIATFTYENSYQSFRTDFDSEVGRWLRRALQRAFEEEPIQIRMSGGSIPISPFVNTLGIPAVTVPTVNRDNNQHSPNENLRLGNYRDGIRTMLGILTEPL